jgi:hypothetical protein
MTPVEKLEKYIRERHATNQSFDNLVDSLKQQEKKQMIGFHKWMLKNDTPENAETYFHFTDEDMVGCYLSGDWGPGWRDLEAPICEYSGLRPVEGYKEEVTPQDPAIDDILEIEETDEERAYRKGYMDGYDEGVYDGMNK